MKSDRNEGTQHWEREKLIWSRSSRSDQDLGLLGGLWAGGPSWNESPGLRQRAPLSDRENDLKILNHGASCSTSAHSYRSQHEHSPEERKLEICPLTARKRSGPTQGHLGLFIFSEDFLLSAELWKTHFLLLHWETFLNRIISVLISCFR